MTEIDEAGSVNRVSVHHSGTRLLLLLDGEQILGAKQNRVFNASFLVPPGAQVDVPVSCVEQGRWCYGRGEDEGEREEQADFAASRTTLVGSARSAKLKRVTTSTIMGRGEYEADQGAVWRDVDGYLARTHTHSPTSAYADAYDARATDIEQRLAALPPPADNQIGMAAVHGDRLVAMDLFASPGLYARAWGKLARGTLADVHEQPARLADASEVVRRVLVSVANAEVTRTVAPGCGETLHAATAEAVLGAVADGGLVYHALVASP